MDATWYLKRLASMGPTEILHRTEDAGRRRLWRSRPPAPPIPTGRVAGPTVPEGLTDRVGDEARQRLLAAADELLAGRWTLFGRPRSDMTADLDYFLDPVNGVRAPDDRFSLTIDHRDEAAVGNIKYVWEAARHQHLTVLAAAWACSGDDRYADRVAAELGHYWATNPFLVGIHWTSGIELGIRLLSWTWIRRLLDGWAGAPELFEANPVFVDQLGRHQQWLASLGSHGSSANNHVIAEAAGQFVAATAFPLFRSSGAWQAEAAEELARELAAQTFPDGLNRELASDYHGFVLELGLVAWVEAVLVGHPVAVELVDPLGRAIDALHAVVDATGRPHRQGDSDDAHGLLTDPLTSDRWRSLLATGSAVVEPAPWWFDGGGGAGSGGEPVADPDVRTALFRACVEGRHEPRHPVGRSATRPGLFPDAGLSILRTGSATGPDGADELWCVVDHGPHGFLSTAAHAHADALAVEVRSGGVEIIADPGTYCYHGERAWRDHFRSTPAHATVTLAERDQSTMAGPFLWTAKATATLEAHQGLATDGGSEVAVAVGADGHDGVESAPVALVLASHDGYADLGLCHRREVRLDRRARTLTLVDRIDGVDGDGAEAPGAVPLQLSLPLGPDVDVELDPGGGRAQLVWKRGVGEVDGRAAVTLDPGLAWSVVRGSESPPAGWYSGHFGTRVPASVIIGKSLASGPGAAYTTIIAFPASPRGS